MTTFLELGIDQDMVDALTQAAHRLLLVPILEDQTPPTVEDGGELDWLAAAAW